LELKATSVIGNIELQQKDEKEVKEELETTCEKGKVMCYLSNDLRFII